MKSSFNHLKILTCVFIAWVVMMQSVFAFEDLEPKRPSTPFIEEFFGRGLTNGYPDGTFRPMAAITRAEFLTLINRTFGFTDGAVQTNFKDVSGEEWYANQLKIAVKKGYIKGYVDGTFRPMRNITRSEVAVVLNRILGYEPKEYIVLEDKEKVGIWAQYAVQSLLGRGIMVTQENLFNGQTPITREDTVVSLITVVHQKEAELASENVDENGVVIPVPGTVPVLPPVSSGGSTSPSAEVIYAMQMTCDGLQHLLDDSLIVPRNMILEDLDQEQLQIIRDIKATMQSYLADYSYPYEAAAQSVNTRYKLLSLMRQEAVENAISAYVASQYLNTLDNYFHKN